MATHDDATHGHRHDAGLCTECGHAMRIERSYKINDRLIQLLLVAVARNLGLDVYRKGRKNSPVIYVAATDVAALDRYDARISELSPLLDAELVEHAIAFVKQHTGVELKLGA